MTFGEWLNEHEYLWLRLCVYGFAALIAVGFVTFGARVAEETQKNAPPCHIRVPVVEVKMGRRKCVAYFSFYKDGVLRHWNFHHCEFKVFSDVPPSEQPYIIAGCDVLAQTSEIHVRSAEELLQ